MTAELSADDLTKAIKQYVEGQTGMQAEAVSINVSPSHDYHDRPTGTYSVTASVKLKKRVSVTAEEWNPYNR